MLEGTEYKYETQRLFSQTLIVLIQILQNVGFRVNQPLYPSLHFLLNLASLLYLWGWNSVIFKNK